MKKMTWGMSLLLLCGFLWSCASGQWDGVPLASVLIEPWWYKTGDRFEVRDYNGDIRVHPFYDQDNFLNADEKNLNFFVLNPEGAEFRYGFDLVSGQRFLEYKTCEEDDVWNSYDGEIKEPPFTTGIVPRMLDQLNQPQLIFVFGRKDYYQKAKLTDAHRVRVIGGIIEDICFEGNCVASTRWQKRMVLLGIDPFDSRFKDVHSFDDLKSFVDLEYVKAFIQNGRGRNFVDKKGFPAYRATSFVKADIALRFIQNNAHLLDLEKLEKIRTGCHHLYKLYNDKLSLFFNDKELSEVREALLEAQNQKRIEDTKTALRKLAQLKLKRGSFYPKWLDITQRYLSEISSCYDLVSWGDLRIELQDHVQDFWFHSFNHSFVKLYEMNFAFNCKQNSWFEEFGRLGKGQEKFGEISKRLGELRTCTIHSINNAFSKAPEKMRDLKMGARPHYSFFEYDFGVGGSGQKIMNWVFRDARKPMCRFSSDQEKFQTLQQQRDVYPRDMIWPRVGEEESAVDNRLILHEETLLFEEEKK